jgi:6-phosphogluconolactonase
VNRLVVGAYTSDMGGKAEGLTVLPGGQLATPSPSYVIADGSVLFAVNEGEGAVSSYSLDIAGGLRMLSTQPTGGNWPCHLALHDGYLIAANYGSGSVSVHPVVEGVIGARTDLVQHSGAGPNTKRQEGPHPHQVRAADGTVTIVDLGLDQLVHYRLDSGRLNRVGATVLPAGSGPRHYVDHPSGRRYVVAELGSAVLTLEGEVVVATTAATAYHVENLPSAITLAGDYLYVANRGADTIATFRLDDEGVPVPVAEVPSGGVWPRDFALTGDGLVVANERSHNLAYFRLSRGVPVATGETVETGSPTSVLPISRTPS